MVFSGEVAGEIGRYCVGDRFFVNVHRLRKTKFELVFEMIASCF